MSSTVPDVEAPSSFAGYRQLSNSTNHIRLLRIYSEVDHAPIHCHLQHHPIDEAPPYHALSYCWGEPGKNHAIIIDGASATIRETAGDFLKSLRRKFGEVLVWIDMLCINQRDIAEKNSQVELMGDIYRNAASVYAWVGLSDHQSDLVFKKSLEVSPWEGSEPCKPLGDSVLGLGQQHPKNEIRPALDSLFLRPYFTRLWIIQELILARDVTFVCGSSTLPFHVLHRTCEEYNMNHFDLDNKTNFIHGWTTFHKIANFRGNSSLRYPLGSLFGLFRYNKCTNPRDKVYGFHQLLPNFRLLPVDYSKSTLEIFMDVLRMGLFDDPVTRNVSVILLQSMGETPERFIDYADEAGHLDSNLTLEDNELMLFL